MSSWWVSEALPADQALRARFFVQAHCVSLPMLLISLAVYWAGAQTGQLVAVAAMVVTSVVALTWFRHAQSLAGPTRLSLVGATLMFGGATLSQTPPDITNVCFLSAIPLLAAFTLGRREAVVWAGVELVTGGVVLLLSAHGYTLPVADANPITTSAFNFIIMVLVLLAFARAYDEVSSEAFEQLRQADRAKSTFLATISHEIRTPMNGVLGLTEVMLTEPMAAPQRENLLVIQRSGKLLVSLINDLLDVSKAEAGKLTLEQRNFSLLQVLEDVRALFEPVAKQKGLALKIHLDESLSPLLRGDPLRLNQVLNNLVSNAVKFTPSGEVLLRVIPARTDALTFEVADTGIGIEHTVLPRLFTAFQQGDGTTTRRFGGTGLGLALAQQLVTLMGGRIEVESEPGAGSRFFFTLPLPVSTSAWVDVTPANGMQLPRPSQSPVLVVDDNPVNLAVAAQLVEKTGHRARKADSGAEAVRLAATEDFVLVLMDCHMPEMDGFEATERIRALPGSRGRVPIVALTASTLPDDLAACRRSGMDDVLTKPVSLVSLSTVLQRVLRVAA